MVLGSPQCDSGKCLDNTLRKTACLLLSFSQEETEAQRGEEEAVTFI